MVDLRSRAASGGGALLAAVISGVAAVRPARKPLHPRGEIRAGVLRRRSTGGDVPWLPDLTEQDVVVRLSRAVGLPRPLPDIHGLALRIPIGSTGAADLLFASTGLGRLGRFFLTGGRDRTSRPLTTLLPYRTQLGPVVLGAVPTSDRSFALTWATATGRTWQTWADLDLAEGAAGDPLVSFDPVTHQVPGLEQYDWIRRLREPAYATARRTRR